MMMATQSTGTFLALFVGKPIAIGKIGKSKKPSLCSSLELIIVPKSHSSGTSNFETDNHLTPGSIFTNHPQGHSLSFSQKFANRMD